MILKYIYCFIFFLPLLSLAKMSNYSDTTLIKCIKKNKINLRVKHIGNNLSVNTFFKGNNKEKKIVLSFDDAPFYPYTYDILKILKSYNCKAIFFIIGIYAEQNEKILKKIAEEGHILGNHSFTHRNFSKLNTKQIKSELLATQFYINKYYKPKIKWFRPPGGLLNFYSLKTLAKLNYKILLWDVDPNDWLISKTNSEDLILKKIVKYIKPGSIILLHSTNKQTIHILPIILEYLKLNNYKIVFPDELLSK